MVAATVANFSGNSRRHDFSPRDFAPRKPESVADKVRRLFGVGKE